MKHLVAVNLDWIDLNFDQGGSNSVRVFDVRSDQPNSIFIFSGGGSSRLQFQDCEFDHFDVTGTTYVDVEYCTIDEHFQIYGTQYDEWVRVKDSYINGDGLIVTGDGKDHVQIEDVIWYGDVKIVSGYNQYKLDDYTDMDTVEIFGMFVYDLEIRMGDSCDWLEMANGDVEFWAQGVVDIHGGNSLDCMQLNRLPTEFRIDWMFNGRHTHYERMNFIWESVEYAFGTR